ncbi:MAG: molybdopterin molybdenumtransferase MoeA [Anaerolineales bacterium]|nr:molybdopterin molybdenumtransferase MoeA [Anaerolineales bacterium]
MPEFLKLSPPDQALVLLLKNLPQRVQPEEVNAADALGRVTSAPVVAPYPLPSFPRATVDGFAVRAADTYGASESLPAYLSVSGEVPMGAASAIRLSPGSCALIHTGGMLPAGADAVVMVEYTQSVRPQEVEILRAVAVGENILKEGEDVAQGQEVIPAGTRLRPAEIGGLMALGITRLMAARQPLVGIISSGDEVISPDAELQPGQVRDVNSYSLGALVHSAGGIPRRYGIVPDRLEAMRAIATRAQAENDLVVITAGSSASARDLTAQVIDDLGAPGVLVHGVNVRPGKPTILAVCDGKAIIGLPGNPVSALVIAWLFVVPVIEALQGLSQGRPRPRLAARLGLNLASQAGREDWVAVRLQEQAGGYLAEPLFGKSNLIFTLARADGLVRIPPDANGLNAGEIVEVHLI